MDKETKETIQELKKQIIELRAYCSTLHKALIQADLLPENEIWIKWFCNYLNRMEDNEWLSFELKKIEGGIEDEKT